MDLVDVDAETIDTNAVVIEENNQENETDNKKGNSSGQLYQLLFVLKF